LLKKDRTPNTKYPTPPKKRRDILPSCVRIASHITSSQQQQQQQQQQRQQQQQQQRQQRVAATTTTATITSVE
jgi:hypothetical protein